MSGKVTRGQRLETEIERSREESNWKKVIELAEHLKSRNQAGFGKLRANCTSFTNGISGTKL